VLSYGATARCEFCRRGGWYLTNRGLTGPQSVNVDRLMFLVEIVPDDDDEV